MKRFELLTLSDERERQLRAELKKMRTELECIQAWWTFERALFERRQNIKAGYDPNQPRVPAGSSTGGQWSGDGSNITGVSVGETGKVSEGNSGNVGEHIRAISEKYNWGNPELLNRHFEDHKSKLNVKSAEEYAKKANEFYETSLDKDLPRLINKDGYIKIYDPETKEFGVYSPKGKTETYMQPRAGDRYFSNQIMKETSDRGRFINSPSGRAAGFIDPKNPFERLPDDDLLR